METDLEELIAIVYTAGKDVEESSKVLVDFIFENFWSENILKCVQIRGYSDVI